MSTDHTPDIGAALNARLDALADETTPAQPAPQGRADLCRNQEPVTGKYCGKAKGHDGQHMNLHSLDRWVSS